MIAKCTNAALNRASQCLYFVACFGQSDRKNFYFCIKLIKWFFILYATSFVKGAFIWLKGVQLCPNYNSHECDLCRVELKCSVVASSKNRHRL